RSIALATGGDVRVAIDNGSAVLSPGNAVRYLVEVENVGSQQVDAIALEVPLAAELVGASWTCTASGGASCTASGSGGIADTLVLGSGQRVRYTLDAVVDPALDPLVPRVLAQPVTASVPGGSDFNLGNNSAVDEDLVFYILFRDGFEPPVPLRGPAGSDLLDASECARAGVPAQQCQARSMGDQ